jgi:hypothetical protein
VLNALPVAASGQAPGRQAADPKAPDLKVNVLLDRESLSAGDSTRLHVWVANPSATPVDSARVRVTAPWFVDLHTGSGDRTPSEITMALGKIPALNLVDTTVTLWTGDQIEEGEAGLAISVDYFWTQGGGPATGRAWVVAEKKLKIGLLGNETVAGVSLRLASLLVPGLLCFLLLRAGGVGWASDLDSTPMLTLSVVLSVLLAGIASKAFPGGSENAISNQRFIGLSLSGPGLALVYMGAAHGIRRWGGRNLVEANDSESQALEKVLKQAHHPIRNLFAKETSRLDSRVVAIKGGERLTGSVAGRTAEGGTVLLGWFKLSVPAGEGQLLEKLEKLQEKGNWLKMLQVAQSKKLAVKPNQSITTSAANGGSGQIRRLAKEDVLSNIPANGTLPPLVAQQD